MKQFKSDKGITLIMLVIYILVATVVIGILATLTANFRKNLNNINSRYSL